MSLSNLNTSGWNNAALRTWIQAHSVNQANLEQ